MFSYKQSHTQTQAFKSQNGSLVSRVWTASNCSKVHFSSWLCGCGKDTTFTQGTKFCEQLTLQFCIKGRARLHDNMCDFLHPTTSREWWHHTFSNSLWSRDDAKLSVLFHLFSLSLAAEDSTHVVAHSVNAKRAFQQFFRGQGLRTYIHVPYKCHNGKLTVSEGKYCVQQP